MRRSTATVATEHASRYLQQLCKHWSHRFTTTFDPQRGQIEFGGGQSVELSATQAELVVSVIDEQDDADVTALERVVAEHIERFAFREQLAFNWKAT